MMETTHDPKRNQVIRNMDVGLENANGKDFYFSLFILDEEHSPKGLYISNESSYSFDRVKDHLPHRKSGPFQLSGMGVFSWIDLLKIFKEAGFPDSVVNIVTGPDVTIDEAKTSQPILIRLPLQDPHQPSIIISALIFP